MNWMAQFAARHNLSPDAEQELRARTEAPLSGMFSGADEHSSEQRESDSEWQLTGLLGRGAIGEVYRAYEPTLHREVALKVLRADRLQDPHSQALFAREARILASLRHPAIPPVYRVGNLKDGRPYFAMLEVVGRTFRQVCVDHHTDDHWLTLRHRVTLLRQLADAAGHAHRHRVVHRDIKPSNAMLGERDAVHLVDWGLAVGADSTVGSSAGTPGWMAPELVDGAAATPASDVWALGRMLHALLDESALDQHIAVNLPTQPLLTKILERALAVSPAARWSDGSDFADALADWLDGDARLKRARDLVATAAKLQIEARAAAAAVAALQEQSESALKGVLPTDPVDHKRVGWQLEDQTSTIQARVQQLAGRRLQALHDALGLVPELPSALTPLADWHQAQHSQAEQRGDDVAADAHLIAVRRYDRGRLGPWLNGQARLTLVTEPPGAEVVLCHYKHDDRRWVPTIDRSLGRTPLDTTLPHGDYLLLIRHPERVEVRYPIHLERMDHWNGSLDSGVRSVYLPKKSDLDPGDIYVAGGPFLSGADRAAFQSLPPSRSFLGGFVMRRQPVTQAEYLTFLNALVAAGEADRAHQHAPRDRGMPGSYYAKKDDGYALAVDSDGDYWKPNWPAFYVNAADAEAYAAWWSVQTSRDWRLPLGMQHEKAMRGADGRPYPWGDFFDPTFACLRESHTTRPLPATIDEYPVDCSVYGVRGLAGNVRTWCLDQFAHYQGEQDPSQRELRGGCYFFPSRGAHGAVRMGLDEGRASDTIGFRLVRWLDCVSSD